MKQTRMASFVEATTNVVLGFAIALLTQVAIFPLFEIDAGLLEHLSIAAIFTVVSLVRSYALRRAFEAWRARSETQSATGLWVWWRF